MWLIAATVLFFVAAYFAATKWSSRKEKAALRKEQDQTSPTVKEIPVDTVTDRRRLGYRFADDDLFVQGESVYTGLVLPLLGDEMATVDETGDLALYSAGLYKDLLSIFDGQLVHCMEQVRYRSITSTDWLRQLIAHAWDPTPLYTVLAGKAAVHLEGSTPRKFWSIIIRLGDLPRRPAKDPYQGVADRLGGVAEERLTKSDLASFREQAEQVHRVGALHGADPMTRQDLMWLIRKPAYGHLPMPDLPEVRRRPWRGGFFELSAKVRAQRVGGGVLKLTQRDPHTGQDQHSYTATLVTIDELPRKIFNPKSPWARRLAALDTPVEIIWRYTLVPGKQWDKDTKAMIANVEDERRDREQAGAGTDLAFENRLEQAGQLMLANAEDPEPGMVGRLRLSVSASTPRGLARAIKDVKTAMRDIQVEVPDDAELLLLAEQLPGEGRSSDLGSLSAGPAGGIKLWERYSDIYKPAMGLLGVQSQVGDRQQMIRGRLVGWIGMVVGWVKANGLAVHFDAHAQLARGAGAGIAVPGASGGGKSSFALAQMFWMSESGVLVKILDPKIEFRNFMLYLCFGPQILKPGFMTAVDDGTVATPGNPFQPVNQRLWDDTEIIDLARSPRGVMGPWRMTKTFGEGYALAENIIDGLFANREQNQVAKKGLRELRKAWKASGERMKVGLGDLATYLIPLRDELARDLVMAREGNGSGISNLRAELETLEQVIGRLEIGEETPFLRAMLDKGSDQQTFLKTKGRRRTIYTLAGYIEPEHPDQELWTDENRNAATLMTVMLRDLYEGMKGDLVPNPVTGIPGRPPHATIVDEAPTVTGQRAGRSFIRKAIKQGRSLNAVLLLLDQLVDGLSKIEEEARGEGEEGGAQFPTVVLFKQNGLGPARRALAIIRDVGEDMPKAERDVMANQLREPHLVTGEAVFKDSGGRRAAIHVDQLFWPLQYASQTNASLVAQDWAHPVPTRPEDWEINPEALLAARTAVARADAVALHGTDGAAEDDEDDEQYYDEESGDVDDLEEDQQYDDEPIEGAESADWDTELDHDRELDDAELADDEELADDLEPDGDENHEAHDLAAASSQRGAR